MVNSMEKEGLKRLLIEKYSFKPYSPNFVKLIIKKFEDPLFEEQWAWVGGWWGLEDEIKYFIRFFEAGKKEIVPLLKRYYKLKGANILDCAGGGGGYAAALASVGANVVGIEINPWATKISKLRAREHNLKNIEFILADARKLPLKTSAFDICLSAILEHITTGADQALMEMWRTLRRGGMMYISSPNRLWPIDTEDTKLWFINYMPRKMALLYARLRGRLVAIPGKSPELGLNRFMTYWDIVKVFGAENYALLWTFKSSYLESPRWGGVIRFLSWVTEAPTFAFSPKISFVAKKIGG